MSQVADPYDPQAPEDQGPRRSAYLSRKEIRTGAIVLAVLFLVMLPVYNLLKGRSEKSLCSRNMGQISTALGLYAAEHDDRFPPLYVTGTGGEPAAVDSSGLPYTWGADLAQNMQRGSLVCPTAQDSEKAQTAHPLEKGKTLPMTYGMYVPYGGYARSSVENPDEVVVIAETSNRGARQTFDPLPFSGGDAFVIGWDNDNFEPNASSRSVTRLAFPESKGGVFKENGPTRHEDYIHALSASGQLLRLKPNQAEVEISRSLGLPSGMWTAPPKSKRSR